MKKQVLDFFDALLLSLIAFLAPIHGVIIAVFFLLGIDFVLGVWCAKRSNIPFQSREAKKTVIKIFIYQMAIISGFLIDTYFLPFDLVMKAICAAIGITEIKSILESTKILTGLDAWDLLKEKLATNATSVTKQTISQDKDKDDK